MNKKNPSEVGGTCWCSSFELAKSAKKLSARVRTPAQEILICERLPRFSYFPPFVPPDWIQENARGEHFFNYPTMLKETVKWKRARQQPC